MIPFTGNTAFLTLGLTLGLLTLGFILFVFGALVPGVISLSVKLSALALSVDAVVAVVIERSTSVVAGVGSLAGVGSSTGRSDVAVAATVVGFDGMEGGGIEVLWARLRSEFILADTLNLDTCSCGQQLQSTSSCFALSNFTSSTSTPSSSKVSPDTYNENARQFS